MTFERPRFPFEDVVGDDVVFPKLRKARVREYLLMQALSERRWFASCIRPAKHGNDAAGEALEIVAERRRALRFVNEAVHGIPLRGPGFAGDPKQSNEGKLEAIQMAWLEEHNEGKA